jgi:hypothetical protein
MQVGVITIGGRQVGVITQSDEDNPDTFMPDISGYVPMGRASEGTRSGLSGGHHGVGHSHHGGSGRSEHYAPKGEQYESPREAPFRQGSEETDRAIVDAARAHNLDPNTMRGIASIESGMNPASNANSSTQYKGLYQVGREEWSRFGNGTNIYSAKDNAMATGRMFEANRNQFRSHFKRDPTDTEMYMMHQQGLGFYTNGAMTNIHGNPYPGMHGPQTHESFEAGWGRELSRRKAGFAGNADKKGAIGVHPVAKPFDPGTDAL